LIIASANFTLAWIGACQIKLKNLLNAPIAPLIIFSIVFPTIQAVVTIILNAPDVAIFVALMKVLTPTLISFITEFIAIATVCTPADITIMSQCHALPCDCTL
jgi:uncharacterized MnhB-related membrane protein